MLRFLKWLSLLTSVVLLIAIIASGVWLWWRARTSLPAVDGSIPMPGLAAQVYVFRDARGVPHIRAKSLSDALFAQGYVTAQDRLWQMDLSRRNAEGTLSEVFGEPTLWMDVESRTLGLPQVAEAALTDFSPEERRLLDAYTRGVNAFIESHRDRLPIEFVILRYEPRPWKARDSVAAALNLVTSLSRTWESDLMRERIAAKLGSRLFDDAFPDRSALDVPVAEVARSSRQNPRRVIAESDDDAMSDASFRSFVGSSIASPGGVGSNNWVVSGSHTRSGKPLLANDPHIAHSVPSVWYMLHLKAPGLDVTGVSLPGVPLVIIGHNEQIAWGVTNTAPDVQDLYAESFNPVNSRQYLHNGKWVDADVRDETIPIRNHSAYQFTVTVTRHGPLISHAGRRFLALQWTLLIPHAIRLPFLQIDQAGNWKEFTSALRNFNVPMQNFVYADGAGNIGYYAAGLVPIRKQGDGVMPVPGSSDDYDWTGFIPFESLPHSFNPAGGIIATANGRIIPGDYPYFITARWDAPFRTARIFQLLRGGGDFTTADMLRIQSDTLSLEDQWLAQHLLKATENLTALSPDARFALGSLKSWDGIARADSSATLILEVTRTALLTRILKPKLGDDISGYRWPMSTVFLQNVLEQNLTRWLPPGDASFQETLVRSLDDGIRRIPQLVHSRNHAAWKWGDTIPLTFHHPLDPVPLLGRWLDVGPFPQAGTGTTVKQTTPRLGPSMRIVVDFSDLDGSLQNITLGESGQVLSPHYRDQFEAWYAGRSFPMPFTDAAVEKAAVHKLILEPRP